MSSKFKCITLMLVLMTAICTSGCSVIARDLMDIFGNDKASADTQQEYHATIKKAGYVTAGRSETALNCSDEMLDILKNLDDDNFIKPPQDDTTHLWEEYEIYTPGSEEAEYAYPYMRMETFAPYNYFIVYWENETYDKETMTHTFYNAYVYFESEELSKLLADENGI